MKKYSLLIVLILFFLQLAAVSAEKKYPQRIVSGMPSITEMLFALDLGDRVVGVTTNCDFPPAVKSKKKVGGFFLNLEAVAALKPDLVLMVDSAQKREIEKFRAFGLPVQTIDPRSVDEVMSSLLALGSLTGSERQASRLVREMKARIDRAKPRWRGLEAILSIPRVIVIVGYDPLVIAGGGTFIDDVVRTAGAANLAGRSNVPYPQYSFEKLLKDDPEYIIIPQGVVSREKIRRERCWRDLRAVKSDNLLFIDEDILSRPGPRVADAVSIIAEFINNGKKTK